MSKIMTITTDEGVELSKQILPENAAFTMFFEEKMGKIDELIIKNPTAARLLLRLCKEMDRTNAIMVSQKTLSEWMDCSVITIKRIIKFLRQSGLIETYKIGSANAIGINCNLAWKADASGRRYARCKADIIISQSEQVKASKKRCNAIF